MEVCEQKCHLYADDVALFNASSLQLSGIKKDKDGEDKKRNPILKYIGKPRTTSQSSKYKQTRTYMCRDMKHANINMELKLIFFSPFFAFSSFLGFIFLFEDL